MLVIVLHGKHSANDHHYYYWDLDHVCFLIKIMNNIFHPSFEEKNMEDHWFLHGEAGLGLDDVWDWLQPWALPPWRLEGQSVSFLEQGLLGIDDISQSVLSLRSAPDVQFTWEVPEDEGQPACGAFSPGGQRASPSATGEFQLGIQI